jgi:hypothetical protein
MNKKKVALTLGASLAIAIGSAAFIAPSAYAGGNAGVEGASANFISNGEIFTLHDVACDGNPVYLVYKINGSSENRINLTAGCGSSGEYNKSYSEGTKVQFKVCVDIRPGVDRCSGWTTTTA